MTRYTLGIDEAGRGPVLGPMVLAAVCLDTSGARALSRAGLRDSKAYSAGDKGRQERARLADKVRAKAVHIEVHVVDVAVIDRRVKRKQLNVLEREVAEMLIRRAPRVDRIVADGKNLFKPLAVKFPELVAWDKAESRHAAVAAASVMAKHRRDEIFKQICNRYRSEFGELRGGGYVNQGTRDFLRAYALAYHGLPPEARRSWPHEYLRDILGDDYDARREIEEPDAQLDMF